MQSNQFVPRGVQQGYGPAYAPTGVPNVANFALMSALSKGFSKSSSSSSKISIVKYDDHFKEKDWCKNHLRKPDGTRFTPEEIKENPPLALKFDDCPVVVPIPSYLAMHATAKVLIKELMGSTYIGSTEDQQKEVGKKLSEALIKQYVEDCNYDADELSEACAVTRLPHLIPPTTAADIASQNAARTPAALATVPAGNSYPRRDIRTILGLPGP